MWRKIRSSLILKKIMNNIENKIKFNLILYNKSIQKKLGLDLNDFRRFSGRYKIEESGIIKELIVIIIYYYLRAFMEIIKEMD